MQKFVNEINEFSLTITNEGNPQRRYLSRNGLDASEVSSLEFPMDAVS